MKYLEIDTITSLRKDIPSSTYLVTHENSSSPSVAGQETKMVHVRLEDTLNQLNESLNKSYDPYIYIQENT
jgi:hypothetical protein